MRKNNGFTLVEMMTVIAIMAIVSAIAVPNFYSYAAGMKLRSASRDLLSTLQNTRMKAIRQNTRWAVQINDATKNYQVIDCGIDNTCGTGDDDIKSPDPISPGVSISKNFASNQFVFNSEGTCSNAGTVTFTDPTITDPKKKPRVDVSLSGGMRILYRDDN